MAVRNIIQGAPINSPASCRAYFIDAPLILFFVKTALSFGHFRAAGHLENRMIQRGHTFLPLAPDGLHNVLVRLIQMIDDHVKHRIDHVAVSLDAKDAEIED